MKNVFVVTMWSGGKPARKWKSDKEPDLLPQGTGVSFINADSKLRVQIIGSISVEEFESGKEEIEIGFYHHSDAKEEPRSRSPFEDESNIQRLF